MLPLALGDATGALALGVIAVVALLYGLLRAADVVSLLRTPSVDVSAVGDGRATVVGTVAAADELLTAPLSGADAVAYEYAVEERRTGVERAARRSSAREVAAGDAAVPFVVDDGTGELLVDPTESEDVGKTRSIGVHTSAESEYEVEPGESPPAAVRAFHDRTGGDAEGDGPRSYTESRLEPGARVTVSGTARRRDGRPVIAREHGHLIVGGPTRTGTLLRKTGAALLALVVGVGAGVAALALLGVV